MAWAAWPVDHVHRPPRERLTEPSVLDRFLTARWGLHQTAGRRTLFWPNEHEEWPLHCAEVLHLTETWWRRRRWSSRSPGVHARFGPREPV